MALPEDMWESVRKCGHGLHWWERELSNVVALFKAKNSLDLTVVDVLLNFDHVWVHVLDVIDVREDKGFLRVEAKSKNIFDIVETHLDGSFGSFKLHLLLVDVFLVVSDLNDKRDVKDALEPLGKNEGDAVTHVEGISGRTSASVQIERLFVLVSLQALL